ncbi:MAG: glutamine amidotransferase [Pseudomonadota bacterium]
MERVILVRHEDDLQDDRVTGWLTRHDVPFEVIRPYRGEALPQVDGSVLGSVVYGGKFNVFEEHLHPFLKDENRWVEGCLNADVPILGICQGAQTMAHVMGAKCGPLEPEVHEFGYYELTPTDTGRDLIPDGLRVVQAHFHGFEIPAGAERLASSDLFPNQAMRAGPNAYAFQFHAEVTPTGMLRWQNANEWNAFGKPGAQTREEQNALQPVHDPVMGDWFNEFLDGLFARAGAQAHPAAAE